MKGTFKFLESINNPTLCGYIFIIISLLLFFKKKIIGLNVFLALILAAVAISYFYDKKETIKEIDDDLQKQKLDSVKPIPTNFKDHNDLVDFFFSVQDMYHYNPMSYEETIDNINNFFDIYKSIERGTVYCDQYYQIAESKKNNALNSFQSMILNIRNNPIMIDKFNRAHKRLETIMNKYINELYDLCFYDLLKKGYDVHRRAINIGPKEYNHYFDKNSTYQFY